MNLFVVGKITGSFGLCGYVKVQPITHSPERYKTLRQIYLETAPQDFEPFEVVDAILEDRSVRVKLSGVDDRTSAERLIGKFLFVEEGEIVEPAEGSYFVHDILGCTASTTEGRALGTIEDIFKLPAHDVWVIRNGKKRHMIPAVRDFIKEIDTRRKMVVVRIIPGLIEE